MLCNEESSLTDQITQHRAGSQGHSRFPLHGKLAWLVQAERGRAEPETWVSWSPGQCRSESKAGHPPSQPCLPRPLLKRPLVNGHFHQSSPRARVRNLVSNLSVPFNLAILW